MDLSSSQDIRAVFAARTAAGGSGAVVHARARADAGPGRVAVVAGRAVGGAVERNRAKRRLRAALEGLEVPAGLDLVVVARGPATRMPFTRLRDELIGLVQRVRRRAEARAEVGG